MTEAQDSSGDERRQILRFLCIGGTSVLIDGTVYFLLTWLGLSPLFAKGLGYCAGMVFGFFGNKLWTFRSASQSAGEPLSYILVYALSLLVNIAVNQAILSFGAGMISETILPPVAFVVATGMTTVLNFLGLRFITFRSGIRQRRSTEVGGVA